MIENLKFNAKKFKAFIAALVTGTTCVFSSASCANDKVAVKPTKSDDVSVMSNIDPEETTLPPDVTTDRTTDKIVGETTDNETTYTTILTDKGETIVNDVKNITTVGSNTKKDESTSRGTVVDNTESNDITSNSTTKKTTVSTTPSKTTSSTTRKTTVKTTASTTRKTTPETIKSSSSTTTTTTTTKPITTTTTTTEEPVVTDEVRNDYTFDDIRNNDLFLRIFAGNFSKELIDSDGYNVCFYEMPYGYTNGSCESNAVIIGINESSIPDFVVSNCYSYLGEDMLLNGIEFMFHVGDIQKATGLKVKFKEYALEENKDIGEFLDRAQDAFFEGNIEQFILDNVMNGDFSSRCLCNPAVMAILCSYDPNEVYMNKSYVEENIVAPFMNHIFEISFGYSYTK